MCRPPSSSTKAVIQLLLRLYPFSEIKEATLKQLPSYEDRNYYFSGLLEDSSSKDTGQEFVLKIFNLSNTYELVEGMNGVMKHLKDKGFLCSYPITTRKGVEVELLSENQLMRGDPDLRAGRRSYCVSVLRYLPGNTLRSVEEITSELAYEAGGLVGRIDAALLDFRHPALDSRQFSDPIWDLTTFPHVIRPLIASQNSDLRTILETVAENIENHVQPRLPSMSHGLLHYDATINNILVSKRDGVYHVSGIIDFSDCMHNYHVFELATMVTSVLSLWKNPVPAIGHMIAGYVHAFPLSREELDCLYHIVMARQCVILVATLKNCEMDKGNSYLKEMVSACWKSLRELMKYSKEEIDSIWL